MSVINDFQVSGLFPSVVSAAVSTAQYFPRLLGTSIGVQSVAPSATSAAGQLVIPGNSELENQWTTVLIAGQAVAGAAAGSATVTVLVRANTGTVTSPSYTTIASLTTQALAPIADGVSNNFGFRIQLLGSTASGTVGGNYTALYNNTPKASGALDAQLSGISLASATPFGLVVSATFSSATAGNVAKLTQFQIIAD